MVELETAIKKVLSLVKTTQKSEYISIEEASGRVLRETIRAPENIPPFPRAAMDGYAVIALDTKGASAKTPVKLRISMHSFPGHPPRRKLKRGEACLISTGAVIPSGADAIVKVEDTVREGNHVLIYSSVSKNKNIAPPGEDLKKGEVILEKGTLLDAPEIGMLARVGKNKVKVSKKPVIGIFSTGDEIVEPGKGKTKSQIYDSNSFMLYSLVLFSGGIPQRLGIAKDNPQAVKKAFQKTKDYDIVVFTGGVSMGETDYVRKVLLETGIKEVFWKVAIKPGKPVFTGIKGKKIFFGLPGNPVSAFTSFMLFVRPCIYKMMGANPGIDFVSAISEENLKADGKRTHLLRGLLRENEGRLYVKSLPFQGSGILKSLVLSNCFIVLPPHTQIKEGDLVKVIPFRNL